jgi:hypothetical protein
VRPRSPICTRWRWRKSNAPSIPCSSSSSSASSSPRSWIHRPTCWNAPTSAAFRCSARRNRRRLSCTR